MKKVYFLTILTAMLLLMIGQSAWATSNAAALFLRIAAGARPGGMGEAFVSIADDATATYWNPAGLGNAPIAGKLETISIPSRYGNITNVVTVNRSSGLEHWLVADGKLVKFNGKSWSTGKDYLTSSDQSIYDFVQSIVSTNNEEQIKNMADRIVVANNSITPDVIDSFIAKVQAHIPDEYKDIDDLKKGLDTLRASYHLCLLKPEQFKGLQEKLRNGLKDDSLSSEELDKITFSLESSVARFLPSHLNVPFTASIDGDITCLGKTGEKNAYVWVGTNNGLYRLSGHTWTHYSEDDSLPSSDILSLSSFGDLLLIGTSKGMAKYFHGKFVKFDEIPDEPVTAIGMQSADNAVAVIGGKIYRFNGEHWSNTYSYTVRLDDTIERVATEATIYKTPAEIDYFLKEIAKRNTVGEKEEESEANSLGDNVSPETAEKETESKTTTPNDTTDEALADTPAIPDSSENESVQQAETHDWFTEGAVIEMPYNAPLRYDVNVISIDRTGTIWVGTTSGLLSFDGKKWTIHGYDIFSVPVSDSTENRAWTTEEIARKYLPHATDDKITVLADNIDKYNGLNGQPVQPGQSVYVYNWNTGATIYSIGTIHGEMYVGTEYGLEHRIAEGWEAVDFEQLDRRKVIACFEFEGASYYVASDGITMEAKGRKEFVLMHVKWLPNLNLDIYYEFGSYVQNIRGLGTFGLSIVYLNYGTIKRTGAGGQDLGEINPYEIAIAASFGTSLSSKLKGGMTGRFIHSRLSPLGTAQEQGNGIASTFAVDMGILYKISRRMQFGAAITNLGPDITYVDADQSDALPRNLGVGLSYKIWDSPYNSLVIQGELNKILVDMNKGVGTELEYAIRHIGAEYWYANFIALRTGYVYDKEGEVKHLTFGAGLKLSPFRVDFAYVPSSIDSPLANTLRISLTGSF